MTARLVEWRAFDDIHQPFDEMALWFVVTLGRTFAPVGVMAPDNRPGRHRFTTLVDETEEEQVK